MKVIYLKDSDITVKLINEKKITSNKNGKEYTIWQLSIEDDNNIIVKDFFRPNTLNKFEDLTIWNLLQAIR